ncbi:MAG: hypothetical protein FD145_566 [Candidatus Saganbacteria bacterium]|uniref:DUF1571 domain-containing protein n=1 Tax=Candidatus Saganbacteria bacterium TaxID=2575572 RepID=A0A833L1N0_UNCSA|nr:MAG: hypothetical protein FD145_566 [Candidatus Saganbacteria bacterium]
MKYLISILFVCLTISIISRPAIGSEDKIIDILRKAEKAYSQIGNYCAVLVKKERINDKYILEEILLKFKKPFKVYLKWIGKNHKGREIIFDKDKNNGNMLVREGSFLHFLTHSLNPKSDMAMDGQRHSIDEIGIGNLITKISMEVNKAAQNNDIELSFSEDNNHYALYGHFLNDEYYSKKFHLFVNKDNYMIKRAVFYDSKGIFEDYTFDQLELNQNFSEKDFRFY